MFVTSVLPPAHILRYPPSFWPKDAQGRAYIEILFQFPLARWLANSTVVVMTSAVLALVISTLAGYSLARFRSATGDVISYILLMTRMIPGTLIVIPLYLLFQRWGVLDTLTALILAYTTFEIPFAAWMMKGYFEAIPVALEEAAQIDGCSPLLALWRVVLPVAVPGVVASFIASAVLGWSDYVFARTLVTRDTLWTVTVGIQSFFGENVIQWNHIMAGSLIGTLPMLVLFLLLGRYIVQGLTAGATKA